MTASEMRGQDMQDAPERIWVDWHGHECFATIPPGKFGKLYRYGKAQEYRTNGEPYVTEAECQRRVDAAVQAEREECAITADLYEDAEDAADAIRARGQK